MGTTPVLSKQDIETFRQEVSAYFHRQGRSFPWRETDDPYHILVSEFMLQQTQTDRVVPKYIAFLEAFPSVKKLAEASPKDVLHLWKGLGYNRRAMYLHRTAQTLVEDHGGTILEEPEVLEELPGIGPYTAAAVVTFVFNKPLVFIETNIRSVFLHYFLRDEKAIPDSTIYSLVEQTLDTENPKEWYYALMDYGVMIKKKHGNPNQKSKHHTKQKPFEGSRRQKRGRIIEALLHYPSLTGNELARHLNESKEETASILNDLKDEGFITKKGDTYSLKDS